MSDNQMTWTFEIPGEPVPKPRQTRADKWKQRRCVMRYRDWCDVARAAAPGGLTQEPASVMISAYLPLPESWSAKKKWGHTGKPHRSKPDIDNLIKSVLDALFPQDACIFRVIARKTWDDGNGPRVVVSITTLEL